MAADSNLSRAATKIIRCRSAAVRGMFDNSQPLRDAVDASPTPSMVEGARFSANRPEAHISSRLAHVVVNPSSDLNTQLLCRAYVYSGGRTFTSAGEIVANRNRASEEQLLANLITSAHELRELSLGKGVDPSGQLLNIDNAYFLKGEKGSGKTFFLNHVLSAHSEKLDIQKVIWVRLNLVDDHKFGSRLHHWMYAQIAKIILRYYDADSDQYIKRPAGFPTHFYRHLLEFVRTELVPELQPTATNNLERMKQVFSRRGNDRAINPEFCDEILCAELFRYARQNEIGFIIVLDGFDRLDADNVSIERFRELEHGIRALVTENAHLGAVLLLTVREETFETIHNTNPYNSIGIRSRYSIDTVEIGAIIKARVEYLREEIQSLRRIYPDIWNSRDWEAILDEFAMTRLFNDADFLALSAEGVLSSNNRAKLQLAQIRWLEFIQKRTGQGYRLTEHMLKGGMRYPSLLFKYRRASPDGNFQVLAANGVLYDNRHLPLIFRPPLLEGEETAPGWYSHTSIMHGVRILQIIRSHQTLVNVSPQRTDQMTVGELTHLLKVMFGYDEDQTNLFLRELDSLEIIRLRYSFPMEFWSKAARIIVCPKLNYILDGCLPDPAYLNLSAMRVLTTREGPASPPLFQAAYIDTTKPVTLNRWIRTKIRNTVALLTILEGANAEQLNSYRSRQRILPLGDRLRQTVEHAVTDGLFEIVDEMIVGALEKLDAVIRMEGSTSPVPIDEHQALGEIASLERVFRIS